MQAPEATEKGFPVRCVGGPSFRRAAGGQPPAPRRGLTGRHSGPGSGRSERAPVPLRPWRLLHGWLENPGFLACFRFPRARDRHPHREPVAVHQEGRGFVKHQVHAAFPAEGVQPLFGFQVDGVARVEGPCSAGGKGFPKAWGKAVPTGLDPVDGKPAFLHPGKPTLSADSAITACGSFAGFFQEKDRPFWVNGGWESYR